MSITHVDIQSAPGVSQIATPAPRAPRRFDFIDALRGWAFLAVLLFHVGQRTDGLPPWLRDLVGTGWSGVQLFFVTSALTLFLSLEQRWHVERHPVITFFLRRFFRIAPMFWLAIGLYLIAYGLRPRFWAPDGLHWGHLAAAALFVHGWHPIALNGVVPGGWSVAVEMMFYLLVPFCFRTIRGWPWAVILFLLASYYGWTLSYAALPQVPYWFGIHERALGGCRFAEEFVYFWLPSQMPVFCLGFLTFFLVRGQLLGKPAAPTPLATAGGLSLQLLAVTLYAAGVYRWLIVAMIPLTGHVFFGVAFAFLAWGLALRPNWLLVNPLTRFLGKISYSAYLLHFLIIESYPLQKLSGLSAAPSWLRFLLSSAAALAITAALATLTYYLVEKPGMALGKKIIARLEQPGRPERISVRL